MEDNTSHERNLTLLKKKAAQVKLTDVWKDLMKRTYGRRKLILNGYDSVQLCVVSIRHLKKLLLCFLLYKINVATVLTLIIQMAKK